MAERRVTIEASVYDDRQHRRDQYLKRTYGISLVEFNKLSQRQDWRCAVCLTGFSVGPTPHVDHDHVTKRVRGLLCAYCNLRVIGRHRDPDLLESAANYLRNGADRVDEALQRVVLCPKKKRKTTRRRPR